MATSASFPPKPAFPRPFGPYLLLSEMGRGGMGEVFLAKKSQLMGIDRYCVLKTLRAEHSDKSEYLGRFLDEARLAVHLNHRNICGVSDVGMEGDTLYMAMELIVGRDLYTVHDALSQRHRRMPDNLALYLTLEILDALDYAHRLRDPVTDEALNLVHRDVSLANIMLSFEGEVKLIDFGLASSRLKTEHTQGDLVMGKLAYLAPEQATNEELDHRCDQFAAAVVCYELLTGERFYEGLQPQAIWMRAGTGAHVPRRMDEFDPELAEILQRALAARRDDRYPSCAAFRKALDEYRLQSSLIARSDDAREFMQSLFPNGRRYHRERLAKFAKMEAELPVAEPGPIKKVISMEGEPVVDEGAGEGPADANEGPREDVPELEPLTPLETSRIEPSPNAARAGPPAPRRSPLWIGLSAAGALLLVVGVTAATLSGGDPPAQASAPDDELPDAPSVDELDPANPRLAREEAPEPPADPREPAEGESPADEGSSPVVGKRAASGGEPADPAERDRAKRDRGDDKPAARAGAKGKTAPRPKPTKTATRPEPAPEKTSDRSARQAAGERERTGAAEEERTRVAKVSVDDKPARQKSSQTRPRKARRPVPKTTAGKLQLLKGCKRSCAGEVLDMSTRLTELPVKDMRRYPVLLDQCVERCR